MLIGGASSFYAERMVSDPNNLIAITGYQDEESPGRALLDLTRKTAQEDRVLTLNGEAKAVSCAVESYSLSAHADGGELTSLIRRLSPRTVCLVHGDPEARGALAEALDRILPDGVQTPDNGSVFAFDPGAERKKRGYGRSVSKGGIGGGAVPDLSALEKVKDYLSETGTKGVLRVQEISEVWFGSEGADVSRVEAFHELLKSGQSAFRPDFRRPYLYHIADKEDERREGRMEMNTARDRISTTLPAEAGLIRCSAHVNEGAYELAVHFPDVFRDQYRDVLQGLEADTGWSIRVRDTPHQARLFEEALGCLPEGLSTTKAPALRIERKEVILQVSVPSDLKPEWERLAKSSGERYQGVTGYTLVLNDSSKPKHQAESRAPADAMEINQAYAYIRTAFDTEAHKPYRVGLKSDHEGGYVEVTFISPSVGDRYRSRLDDIEQEIGWRVRVRQSSNQEQIALEASRLTSSTCVVRAAPKFYPGDGCIVVPVEKLPRSVDRARITQMFEEITGCQIDWECPR